MFKVLLMAILALSLLVSTSYSQSPDLAILFPSVDPSLNPEISETHEAWPIDIPSSQKTMIFCDSLCSVVTISLFDSEATAKKNYDALSITSEGSTPLDHNLEGYCSQVFFEDDQTVSISCTEGSIVMTIGSFYGEHQEMKQNNERLMSEVLQKLKTSSIAFVSPIVRLDSSDVLTSKVYLPQNKLYSNTADIPHVSGTWIKYKISTELSAENELIRDVWENIFDMFGEGGLSNIAYNKKTFEEFSQFAIAYSNVVGLKNGDEKNLGRVSERYGPDSAAVTTKLQVGDKIGGYQVKDIVTKNISGKPHKAFHLSRMISDNIESQSLVRTDDVYFDTKTGLLIEKKNSVSLIDLEGKKNTYVINTVAIESNLPTESNGGGCLIATAAYGSELAPEIQKLREVRDTALMRYDSGATFVSGFNAIYYSFSPTVADFERQNPLFKETVKVMITPLISTLAILNYVDLDSEANLLGIGIGIIGLNLGIYFVLPVISFRYVKKTLKSS